MDLGRIFELDQLAVNSIAQFRKQRELYRSLERGGARPFVSIIGPRGAGKTVLLRQLRTVRPVALYISADTLDPADSLFDVAAVLSRDYKISALFLDEIHFLPGFTRALKEIYDFLSIELWFTSSASLALEHSAWDLSRRVRTFYLPGLTLREYAHFNEDIELSPLPLRSVFANGATSEHLRRSYLFEPYLRGGLYPFMLEPQADMSQFGSMLEKIVSTDIPSVMPSLMFEDLSNIRKTLQFIGKSPVDGVNYSSISRNVGVTKYKAEQYCELLERAFLLRRAFPAGTNVVREPKIFLEPPYRLLYREWDDCIGALREDFFALAMSQHGQIFHYLKSTRGAKTPDFLLQLGGESVVVEVGGRSKGRTQFKEVDYGRKVVLVHDSAARTPGGYAATGPERLSLHLLGFA